MVHIFSPDVVSFFVEESVQGKRHHVGFVVFSRCKMPKIDMSGGTKRVNAGVRSRRRHQPYGCSGFEGVQSVLEEEQKRNGILPAA